MEVDENGLLMQSDPEHGTQKCIDWLLQFADMWGYVAIT